MKPNQYKALAAVILADLVGAVGLGIVGAQIENIPVTLGLQYGLAFGGAVLVVGLLIWILREAALAADIWCNRINNSGYDLKGEQ